MFWNEKFHIICFRFNGNVFSYWAVIKFSQKAPTNSASAAGKHYKIHGVKNGEADLKTEALLDKAANRRKSLAFHITPVVWIDGHGQDDMPRTLQHILSRYPYPVGQGPVVFPLYELRPAPTRAESDVLDCQETL